MKSTFFSFLLLFTCSLFITNMAFAGEPIPGVNVAAGKNPGGQGIADTKSNEKGSFTFNLKAGSYGLTVAYADIAKYMAGVKNYDANSITLTLSSTDAHSGLPAKTVITKSTAPITFSVHTPSATVTGTLTYNKTAASPQPVRVNR